MDTRKIFAYYLVINAFLCSLKNGKKINTNGNQAYQSIMLDGVCGTEINRS